MKSEPQDKYEPASAHIEEAGKGELDDEMLPNQGDPVPQPETGGDQYDTAGKIEKRRSPP